MHTLLAVLGDLLQFLLGLVFTRTQPSQAIGSVPVLTLAPKPVVSLLSESPRPALLSEASVPTAVPAPAGGAASRYVVAYATPLYADPTIAFDNVLRHLPCGTAVTEGLRSGRFVAVSLEDGSAGFVLEEALLPAHAVLPALTRGHRYLADAPQTVAIRQYLADPFGAGRAGLPLTPEEYVTYRLSQSGCVLPWPVSHGRIAGTWARKLRGVAGVHIGVEPRTGAVMEYIIDDVGFLAYLERVSPDLTITVVGIGLTFEAQFTEQVLKERDWRELRPLFLTLR